MIVCQSAPPASAPEPRLTARSMLSLGTDVFLAFWMASYSVGLPAGSPPPVRAATSMFLISLANALPRRASMTAFLCLVVAHLEWPLMRYPSLVCHDRHEELVHPSVARDLRVERRGQQRALANGDDPTVGRAAFDASEHLHGRPDLLDPRCPDEDAVDGPLVQAGHPHVALEGGHLPAEGVAPHGHVDAAEGLLVRRGVQDAVGQQDHPGARAVGGQTVGQRLAQRVA